MSTPGPPSAEERERLAAQALAAADGHRDEGRDRAELTSLLSAATDLLGVALVRFDDAAAGVDYLERRTVPAVVRQATELNASLHRHLVAEGRPSAAIDNQPTMVHLAWLVGEWRAATTLLEICLDERVRRFFPLAPFWAEYCRALGCLTASRAYTPELPRLRGYEKHWAVYLDWISDLAAGRDTTASEARLDDAFADRNRDKRLTDWALLDGDGRHPVAWDFRRASIQAFLDRGR